MTLTDRIASDLRRQIESGAYQPGTRLPSASEICARYEVSNITARAVVKRLVQEGLVESRSRSGVFVAERGPENAFRSSSRMIGLILSGLHSPFYTGMLASIERACREAGYGLKVVGTDDDSLTEMEQLRSLPETVDGLIVNPVTGPHAYPIFEELLERGFPLVLVVRYLDKLDVPTVVSDNEAGGYLMTRHLLVEGRSNLVVIQDYRDCAARDRIDGCHRAFREMRSGTKGPTVVQCRELAEPGGYFLTRDLVRRGLLPLGKSAVFALNSELARGSMAALRECGLKVPEDVALGGFDDMLAMYFDPPLTTVRQDLEGMGVRAVQLLLQQMSGETLAPGQRRVTMPVQLVTRRSTNIRCDQTVGDHLDNLEIFSGLSSQVSRLPRPALT